MHESAADRSRARDLMSRALKRPGVSRRLRRIGATQERAAARLARKSQAGASRLNDAIQYYTRQDGETPGFEPGHRADPRSVAAFLDTRWSALRPLDVYAGSGQGRVTVVTDSLASDSLFGGVATALILACLWADAQGRGVRVVTRTTPPDASGFARLRELHGLPVRGNPQFVQHAPGAASPLEVRPDDVFLTTSWWSTAATVPSVSPERVCYILQEDERMFYPSGDDAVRAGMVMADPRPFVVVNSNRLRNHLMASGCGNLVDRSVAFEPSFELFTRAQHHRDPSGDRHLFFYARPNNPRNLFHLGLRVLDEALASGVLDPGRWTIHMVGRDTPDLVFTGTPRVQYHRDLDWSEYRDLVAQMDLALCLMATPHTSYPPLDLLASGAVVVTNSWPGKSGLMDYGPGLIAGDPTPEGLEAALRRAVDLVSDGSERDVAQALRVPWPAALEEVIERLAEEFPRV